MKIKDYFVILQEAHYFVILQEAPEEDSFSPWCHPSLLQKDGFVIPEVVIGNPVLGKSKSSGFPLTRE